MNIGKILHLINEGFTRIGAVLFLLMAGICVAQVCARYVFSSAMTWPEEAMRFLFIWISYLSIAYGFLKKGHLQVDIIFQVLGKRKSRILDTINLAIVTAFLLYIAWLSIDMVSLVIESEEEAQTLPVPLWMIWSSLTISFFLSGIYSLYNFVMQMKAVIYGEVK